MPPEKQTAPPERQKTATLPMTQDDIPDPAEKLLAAKRKRDEQAKAAEEKKRNEAFVHYLRCPRVPDHVAAFLTEYPKPGAWIGPGQWYSRFRKPGDPHQVPFIQCQECQYEGERRPWPVSLDVRRRPDTSFEFKIQDKVRKHVLGEMPRGEAEKDVTTDA